MGEESMEASWRGEVMGKKIFGSQSCDSVRIRQRDNSVTAKQLDLFIKQKLFLRILSSPPRCMLTVNYSHRTKQIPKCIQTYAGTNFTN